MRFGYSWHARLGFALLFGFGLFGCRAPMTSRAAMPQAENPAAVAKTQRFAIRASDADLAAWADYRAARAEWLAARQELEALKLELGRAKGRVETMRQRFASLEGDLAGDGEVRREKSRALEATLDRVKP